jgi:ADP-ribose pyrophosphatase YjhB (NUDIX family)
MKNFEFEHEGKTYWYSRSLAVNCVLFYQELYSNKWYVLANKRGQGCEFNKGLWNVPGGFIDFDESAEECASRECFEETGYKIDPGFLNFISLETNPKRSKRQTMLAIYSAIVWDHKKDELTQIHSEDNEVECIEWVPINEMEKYEWTYDQIPIIKRTFKMIQEMTDRKETYHSRTLH